MSSDVDTLMDQVERGRTLRILKSAGGGRMIVATSRFGRTAFELPLSKEVYDKVMVDFLRALIERSDDDLDVLAKSDHFGWSIKVSSGLLGHRTSRIFVSRRHFDLLDAELEARRRAKTAAAVALRA